ncbi:sensor histidine kinase KdpD [Eubacteriales bacterium DFI.9.88]|nr:sensor histidine kinase KdpD [Eubacteriales bacterium DFI.9.88]
MTGENGDKRINPDALLHKINQQERSKGKGKLKIFFGYAAGVGKTYTMLDDAHTAQKQGIDVVVGYIEPHTRPETMALLEGLEVLPALEVPYKGMSLRDFDLDGALKRKPDLILVDELAHTNAPGMRHTKRYSDIEELLDAGIDVYTTVNVQHIESLNDVVASITQVIVQERVPDYIFDGAEQLELVDIEPEELLQRLSDGKIYKEKQAEKALNHFFTQDNLVALREISLRYTADQVNQELETIKNARADGSRYQINEHILVCISPSPTNENVIRTAARMAGAFHGRFTALYVETPRDEKLSETERKRLRKNLKLAETLGAKVSSTYSDDIPYQIVEFARVSSISKIVMGRARSKRSFAGISFGKPTFTDRMISLAPDLELFVIPDREAKRAPIEKKPGKNFSLSVKDLMKMLLIMVLSTLLGGLLHTIGLREANVIIIFILGVLITANQTTGKFYGAAASVIGVLSFNFFFTDPKFTLYSSAEYPVTFVIMLIAAFIVSTLTSRAKSQAVASALNVYRTDILLDASSRLQHAQTIDDIVIEAERQIFKIVRAPVIIYTVEEEQITNVYSYDSEKERPVDEIYMDHDEQGVVNWVLKNKRRAGKGTETLPGAKCFYMPIRDRNNQVLAIVGIVLKSDNPLEDMDRSLLAALIGEIAFALEIYYTALKKNQHAMQAEKERFRANLLRAVSHDLRTPLTSISGSASSLLSTEFDEETKKALTQGIYDDSMWLINLVENLLSISRLDDSGIDDLKKEPQLVEEVITEALAHVTRKSISHHIDVKVEDPLLMAEVDLTLIVQVLINLVNNAVEYTPEGSHIRISAFQHSSDAVVRVSDDGGGIRDEDKASVFNMFFTGGKGSSDSRRGMGLGLALCKSIINAHGGEIVVKDNQPRGTIFEFTVPLAEVKADENFNSHCGGR